MKFVKELVILACTLVIGASLGYAALAAETQRENKTWLESEGCIASSHGEQPTCFYFLEDRETHTRCYATRAEYHDGTSISCVPSAGGR